MGCEACKRVDNLTRVYPYTDEKMSYEEQDKEAYMLDTLYWLLKQACSCNNKPSTGRRPGDHST